MAISRAEKAAYDDFVRQFKKDIDDANKRIKEAETLKKKMPNIAPYKDIEIVLEHLKIIMYHISINDTSVEMLQLKKESSLNDARKAYYKALQLMEIIVGSDIDRSLSENKDYLKKIDRINPLQKLRLVQRFNAVLSTLMERMGTGSKWKWSFVDLFARGAVVTRNLINFSDTQKYRDPRTEFYQERQELLGICKNNLKDAALQYRTKYEQSTKATGDILKSIELLTALRKIHVLFGESEEAKKMKTTIDALKQKIEEVEKEEEEQKKKKI